MQKYEKNLAIPKKNAIFAFDFKHRVFPHSESLTINKISFIQAII
jgi:hypothetical protein